ncbi:MAG: tetratricopeptide repeat protein, partial [Anaerolineae bacterium]
LTVILGTIAFQVGYSQGFKPAQGEQPASSDGRPEPKQGQRRQTLFFWVLTVCVAAATLVALWQYYRFAQAVGGVLVVAQLMRRATQAALSVDSEARRWLERRLETSPDDALARFFLGEAHLRLGNTAQAVRHWESIGAQEQLVALADTFSEGGAQAEALIALEAVMRLDATDTRSRRQAAQILREQGNPTRALALYREMIDIAPDKAEGYALAGRVLFEEGRYEQALTLFQQAVARDSKGTRWILARLGQTYAALNNWPKASEAYEQAIQVDPTYPPGFVLLGDAQCQLGHPAQARASYEQANALGFEGARARRAAAHIAQNGSCP